MNPNKPLGKKAYGSTAHLPGSRLGPTDSHCHEGQSIICQVKHRNKHDRVIVSEKLDGSNVAVARIDNQIVSLCRSGFLAKTSPYKQHHMFASWVDLNKKRFDASLKDNEVLNCEWLIQAHGTIYNLPHEPLVVFGLRNTDERLSWDEIVERTKISDLIMPNVISDGPSISIEDVMAKIGSGKHGAIDPVEGAVWLVENKGKFDFIAKYVRSDKVDGKYLPEVTGKDIVWNNYPIITNTYI